MTPDRHAWLESLIRPNLRPYSERAALALESVGGLLHRLGDPHARLRVIHIAGSKGKGATALMIEALLEQMGFRTGTFTSPHLERWTERFRIGGREISRTELDEAIDLLRPHVDSLSRQHPQNPPSFFDVLTALALWLFARRKVDVAIIEAGIGGRYDATNIVRPEVACISNIELEHCDKLGTDIAAIASHKAGILKPGVKAVLGDFEEAAKTVIRKNVNRTGSDAAWLNRDFEVHRQADYDRERLSYRSGDVEIHFGLKHPGRHMAENAALAIACVQQLRGVETVRLKSAAAVLANIALPGRTEVLRTAPWWIVDAAHTRRSIAALADVVDALPVSDRHYVVSLSGKKNVEMLAPLLDNAASITVTSPEPLRSVPAAELASRISTLYPDRPLFVEHDVNSALGRATSRLGPSSLLCATGSTYIAGAARKHLLSLAGRDCGEASGPHSIVPGTRAGKDNASAWMNSSTRSVKEKRAEEQLRGV